MILTQGRSLTKLQSHCRPGLQSSKTLWGWRTHFQAHSRGCWKEASVPLQMGFSTHECPQDRAAGFPQSERSRKQRGRSPIFSSLLESTYYRFCHILLATQTNPDTKQEKTIQGTNGGRAGSLDTVLEAAHHKQSPAMPPCPVQFQTHRIHEHDKMVVVLGSLKWGDLFHIDNCNRAKGIIHSVCHQRASDPSFPVDVS